MNTILANPTSETDTVRKELPRDRLIAKENDRWVKIPQSVGVKIQETSEPGGECDRQNPPSPEFPKAGAERGRKARDGGEYKRLLGETPIRGNVTGGQPCGCGYKRAESTAEMTGMPMSLRGVLG